MADTDPRETGRSAAGQKLRVLKAPAVRRAELIGCAQRLFLTQGYERTTINDVIAATGLSKGAFYHHFRSKEDLLEAIVERFAQESVAFSERLRPDSGVDALGRLNLLLSLGREWKREHITELRGMFATLLEPGNIALYQRIVGAVFTVLTPALSAIIAEGNAESVFDAPDPDLVAEMLLELSTGRRALVIEALTTAETDVEAGLAMIVARMRREEAIAERLLGLKAGRVDLLGPPETIRDMLVHWTQSGAVQAASRTSNSRT